MFASFQFEAVHHQLKQNIVDYDQGATLDADDEGMKYFSFHVKFYYNTLKNKNKNNQNFILKID